MATVKLAQGIIQDPANGVDGTVADLWFRNGTIIARPTDGLADRVYDCRGLVVMPGGIDIHAHIAGPKVNIARKLRPEDRRDNTPFFKRPGFRSGTLGSTPSTFATGYLYAGMGYTTVMDAAIPPLGARHTHEEFHDTPAIDKGFFVLAGNNQYVLQQIAAGEHNRLKAFCAWLLSSTKGYALKVVNPGGVEAWKRGAEGLIHFDEEIPGYGITGRNILTELVRTTNELNLPHPLHIHCNRLGMPGNWKTTLDSFATAAGNRAHFTHIQFHSYGGGPEDQNTFRSQTLPLVEYINDHPELTVDVGQVMFGETTSMTGDGPLGHYLHKVLGRKWFNGDTECEAGCGIVPITYSDKSLVHALQWAIGLEWFLLVKNPWQIALSTDHPNGAAFRAYPEIIALLMSKDLRQDILKKLPDRVKERCLLPELTREYTLQEIAIITRAAPARMLGLKTKGHLGMGADADVCVYDPNNNKQQMFEIPKYVFKTGELIIENTEMRAMPFGPVWHVEPGYDHGVLPHIQDWFEKSYSLSFENYPVGPEYQGHGLRTP